VKVIDFSLYIVVYNFIIGVLIMIASEKLGFFAGRVMPLRRQPVARLAQVGSLTFGACVATLSAGVYLAFYLLKL
jgi:hypothetical protein